MVNMNIDNKDYIDHGSILVTILKAEFKEFEPGLDAVQAWLVQLEALVSVSRFEPVIGGSATRFKFFKLGLRT